MVLVSFITNFFTNKTSLANKWMSFSSSNSALCMTSFCTRQKVQVFKGLELVFAYFQSCFHHHWHVGQWWKLWHKNLLNQLCTMNSFLTKDFLMRLLTRHAGVWAPPQFLTLETKTTCPCSPVCYWGRAKTSYKTWHYPDHGLRTPNEGINQRNLKMCVSIFRNL